MTNQSHLAPHGRPVCAWFSTRSAKSEVVMCRGLHTECTSCPSLQAQPPPVHSAFLVCIKLGTTPNFFRTRSERVFVLLNGLVKQDQQRKAEEQEKRPSIW